MPTRIGLRGPWWPWLAMVGVLALSLPMPCVVEASPLRTSLVLQGEAPGDAFGNSAASAGDVNGDGRPDIIVGAYQSGVGGAGAGRVYVFFGGARMHGKPDVIFTGEAAGDGFGSSVASAGDVNGDGYADIVVGAHMNSAGGAGAGRAYLFFGGPRMDSRPDAVFTGEAAGDAFGYSVASAGDVNGDRHPDIIVGAFENSSAGPAAGRAYIYFGGKQMSTRPGIVLTGEAPGDRFGICVAGAGDMNKDGAADVIVGAYQSDAGGLDAGRAYVYYGGPVMSGRPDQTWNGTSAGDLFGFSVAGAGDVNRDGYSDAIVGAYHNGAGGKDAGRAYVFFGGPARGDRPNVALTGEAAGDAFGYSVGTAGDLNGDGYADVLIGAYGNDAGGAASGRAYVFYGGSPPDITPDLILTGDATLDNLGFSVYMAGDVNGDGLADVVVGAPYHEAGRAYLACARGETNRPVAAH